MDYWIRIHREWWNRILDFNIDKIMEELNKGPDRTEMCDKYQSYPRWKALLEKSKDKVLKSIKKNYNVYVYPTLLYPPGLKSKKKSDLII